MSNPYSQGGQPVPHRPGVVTVAGYLLFATAALTVLGSLASIVSIKPTMDVYADAYAGTAAEGTESVLVGSLVFGVVVNLLLAAGFVALAIFNNKGKNPSRVTTWVIGGLSICCTGFGLAGNAISGAMSGLATDMPSQSGMPDPEEVNRQLTDAIPAWVSPVTVVTSVLTLLFLLAVVVLLALPPANDFFRKPAAVWQPPGAGYPGTGYPGTGYPGAPGGAYPGAPGAGYPGAPDGGYPGAPGAGYPGGAAYPPPSQAPYPPQPAQPGTYPPGYPPAQPGSTPPDYPPPASSPPVSGPESQGPPPSPFDNPVPPSSGPSSPPPSDPPASPPSSSHS
ncbi:MULTISPECIES: hypothetical protein [Catenuloplanes]|uniref:Uncharacterized protein n=1 Tax=Catenuloplanes niger TaxID=587534 RepID=A0AAE3ZRP7_9ACTN|nr:hypothetical protein [Catenuloplanes niger]MDR7323691.1 hypothetical protein [Catenuloplanes niger]